MKRFACCPVCAHKLCKGEKGCYLDIKCPRCGEVIHIEIGDVITTRIVCLIVFAVAPFVFKAELPTNLPLYFCSLVVLLCVTLAIGCIIGLLIKTQAKQTMVAMIIFLPSVMLSGIMFPATMLPNFMQYIAYIFPATIGFQAMTAFEVWHLPVLIAIFVVLCIAVTLILKIKSRR